ncbi:RHS repeat-associated core domain-containing protein [Bacteroides intestinalis]|uniref:RHS repeat-associated core domain protein n=1 Tax=Bacteroides intestinalis TaxID=329854 RepID=A0A139LBT2_9BACE|nr:RHS repeat-associated core domain-containing protein [Bacteroides intestinalis]KXT48898.1 RHS repeat-associated core domain protein [Bacteroides intestinalis]
MKRQAFNKGIIFMISCLYCISGYAQNGTLIISEIFYDSPLNEWMTGKGAERNACHEGGEYIELYNPTLESVNISNWRVYGTNRWEEQYKFPEGTIIAPKELILLSFNAKQKNAADPLKTVFSSLPNGRIFYHTNIILSNVGESITILDNKLKIRDIYAGSPMNRAPYYRWDHDASNGEGSRNKPYKSIQRTRIRKPWNEDVFYNSSDYTVSQATPLSLNPEFPLQEFQNWTDYSTEPPAPANVNYGSTMYGVSQVSSSGAAIHNIPLIFPEGLAGMTPQLAITYNSMTREGILGPKWGISGLSCITKTNKTKYFDKKCQDVTFLPNEDGLALDGIRLALLKDNTYRLENDPYSIITYNEEDKTFTLQTKDGTKITYGVKHRQSPDIWNIRIIEDKNGNYIKFYYWHEVGELDALIKISYTKNSNASINPVTPYNIIFSYNKNNSNSYTYYAGRKVRRGDKLASIEVRYGDTKIKEYSFIYNGGSGKLSEIKESLDEGKTASSINITWDNNNSVSLNSFSGKPLEGNAALFIGDFMGKGYKQTLFRVGNTSTFKVSSISTAYFSVTNLPTNANFKNSTVADVNGDGRDDLLLVVGDNCQVYISTGSGFVLKKTISISGAINNSKETKIITGDFNGDGTNEFGYITRSGSTLYFKCYTLANNVITGRSAALPSSNNPDWYIGDFNGDGETDIAFYISGKMYIAYHIMGANGQSPYTSAPFAMSRTNLYTADFNNDGRTDFLDKISGTQYKRYFSKNNGFDAEETKNLRTFAHYDYKMGGAGATKHACTYDFVLTDLYGNGNPQIVQLCYVNKPQGGIFTQYYTSNPWTGTNESINEVTIVNPKPGATIPQAAQNAVHWISIRNESGIRIKEFTNAEGISVIADLLGTSTEQIVAQISDGSGKYINTSNYFDKQVTQITNNGLKRTDKFTYILLTKFSGYKCTLPAYTNTASTTIRNFIAPIKVVRTMSSTNGKGGFQETSFQYKNMKLHTQGKGLLGFENVTSFSNNIFIQDTYTADNYGNLHLTQKRTIKGNTTIDNTTSYSYEQPSILFSSLQSGLCYVNLLASESTIDNLRNYSIKNTYTYDNWGMLTQHKAINATGTTTDKTTTINFEYTTGATGKPDRITSISTLVAAAGQKDSKRRKNFKYDTAGNIIEEVYLANASAELTSTYTYDNGFLKKITNKDKNGTQRTIEYTYDSQRRFITSIQNSGVRITRSYDEVYGYLLKETNSTTNQSVSYTYDAFGCVSSITDPFNIKQTITTGWASSAGITAPSNAISFIKRQRPNTPWIVEFYDALGRKLQTATETFSGISKVDYNYTAKGQLESQTMPYYSSSDRNNIIIQYDDYGRPLSRTQGTASITYSYNQNKVTQTNSAGQSTIQEINSLGDITKVTDQENKSISYTYSTAKSAGLVSKINTDNSTVSFTHDDFGRKTGMTDSNAGSMNYVYNGFNELTSQINAKKDTTLLAYDNLGRVIKRTRKAEVTTYTYNTKGQLTNIAHPNGNSAYTYNDKGQILSLTENILGKSYTTSFTYSSTTGQKLTMTYPSGFSIKYIYDTNNGILKEIVRNDNNKSIWKLERVNAAGQAASYLHGNGRRTTIAYDNYGRPSNIRTSNNVQALSYTYDDNTGNMLSRKDSLKKLTENFTYDLTNRLTSYQVGSSTKYTLGYDGGNITNKSDIGNYYYKGSKKHAVDSIRITVNNLSLPVEDITYTMFNKISTISQGTRRITFTYGADDQRRSMKSYNGTAVTSEKIYSGDYEKETVNGLITERHYISTPSGITAVLITTNGAKNMYYLCKDHQQSITALMDESGTIREQYAYDAWGKRRNPTNWSYSNVPTPTYLERGYTMHEHISSTGLINMNGRVYDPMLARVLSPDNLLPNMYSQSGLNRYAYCHNNPLMYSDPDGNNPIIAWIGGAFIMLGKLYHDGKKSNHGEANPFKWDYSKMNYVIGFSTGGGNSGVYAGAGWNNDFAFAAGYNGRDYSIGYVQNGQTHMAPFRDRADEALQQAGKEVDKALDIAKDNFQSIYKTDEYLLISQTAQAVYGWRDSFKPKYQPYIQSLKPFAWGFTAADFVYDIIDYSNGNISDGEMLFNTVINVTLLFLAPQYAIAYMGIKAAYTQYVYIENTGLPQIVPYYEKTIKEINQQINTNGTLLYINFPY